MGSQQRVVDAAERFAAFLPAQRHFGVLLGRRAEEHTGLTTQQAASLLAVGDGARRVTDIAELTSQHTSGASRVVESLVERDLLVRRPDDEDRRAVVVQLTADGQRKVEQVLEFYRDTLAAIFGHLDADELEHMLDTYASLLDAAAKELTDDAG